MWQTSLIMSKLARIFQVKQKKNTSGSLDEMVRTNQPLKMPTLPTFRVTKGNAQRIKDCQEQIEQDLEN